MTDSPPPADPASAAGPRRGDTTHWLRTAVIYQVYPRSFADSDGDGVGDLAGVRSKLDYLEWLGVDALWLSPVYPSPMVDFGYDVSDYRDIDPTYGTLAEFDALLADVHGRGMKLLLDLVPNHTSTKHPWFVESRSNRTNAKRDWYVWRDPAPGGGPPCNWLSAFGGSAWEFDDATGQYYFHACLPEQADLNWRNPEVREAMHGVMRFWLDRGVDGFRVDAADRLIEDDLLRDDPPNPSYTPDDPPTHRLTMAYSRNQPESRDIFRELGRVAAEYGDRALIGEVHVPSGQLDAYYGTGAAGLDLPFNFTLQRTAWDAEKLREAIDIYFARLAPQDWPNWVLGNHDVHRVASRIGRPQARVAAVLLLTLRGTATMYNGDELGMTDVPVPPDRELDPRGKRVPGYDLGRDPERTPMQWDASPNAGFTTGRPWLPVADDFRDVNVAAERDDPTSFLNLYRRLIALRRSEPALAEGEYAPVPSPSGTLAYRRFKGGRSFTVLANVTSEAATCDLPIAGEGRVRLSTRLDREGERVERRVELQANEAVVLEMTPAR